MKLIFNIEYRTHWGEDVRVMGSVPELGNQLVQSAFPLQTLDGIHWTAEVNIKVPANKTIQYSYHIYNNGKLTRSEWNSIPRTLHVPNSKKKVFRLQDYWKDLPEDLALYSSAFSESLMAHAKRTAAPTNSSSGLLIKAYAPCDADHVLGICGNQPALGCWDPSKAVLMSNASYPEWQVSLDASSLAFPLEYKFVLYNKVKQCVVAWETNPNRYIPNPGLSEDETIVIGDRFAHFCLPDWKGAGVAIPVFSLRSEESFGVGDFGDLKKFVGWAAATGQKVVQILPINDTNITHTWVDSYPYSSISIYAFHPMYLDLKQLGTLKDKKQMARFSKLQKELNAFPQLDYERVNKGKWEYLRLIFHQDGAETLASEGFKHFFEENKEWLQPYAAFSYLRDLNGTPDFHLWKQYSVYNPSEIEALCHEGSKIYPEIAIYYYIQYHLHLQLTAVTDYARPLGVVLKGDIPIGINRCSVEAWKEPYYFNMNGQAGAPPDDFSANGQNWGFPTYNWEVMEKDGYAWWMRRFGKMAEHFDAYRIDHILGFFRIWEIPMHSVHGLLGQFVPSLPMSKEEIERFGLTFREDFYTQPFIHEYMLPELFGAKAAFVKQHFLMPAEDGFELYRMRPEFDTQRKVEAYFAGKTDEENVSIREGLYSLISDVLFIRDRDHDDLYHPRITVQTDYVFQALTDGEKEAFNRLYQHYYYERHNEFWRDQAMKKLPQLTSATRMLVCGEDLGMIPSCVPQVMNDLRILSLEIQRMPKDLGVDFADPARYPYRSICTISTHDMSTLRGWWEEDAELTQRFYKEVLHHEGDAPAKATPELCEEVLKQHLQGASMLCIPSFQDWLSIDGEVRNPDSDERINIPANPRHYWRWRMHLTIEQLMKQEELNDKIRSLIKESGR
ncbi:MAG: 4-alpha-glucanotransferase [Bacteroidaceae bacterium]|nr:4-alpha-glucanotransferase [Bacteroidaceae bacterium]